MVELSYWFNDEEEFIYEPMEDEIWEVIDEFLRDNGTVQSILILEDSIGQEKLEEFAESGYQPYDVANNSEEDNEELLDELLTDFSESDLIDLFDLVEELKEVCEENAKECYEDWKAYKEDPYAYNGVSRSDFV